MKLIDALERINAPLDEGAPKLRVSLICGFAPLHLQTFLAARLREAAPERAPVITTGLYGDIAGNLEATPLDDLHAAVIVIEWQDLDPRLGLRALGGWRVADLHDIVDAASHQAERLLAGVVAMAKLTPTYLSMPTLTMPPLFPTPQGQCGVHEMRLRETVARLGAACAAEPGLKMVNPRSLDSISPVDQRFDPRSEIATGFPYSLHHASALAGAIVDLMTPRAPKKGIITDLDDTLWAGVLGEVGVDGISWSLDHRSHIHGFYQQLLASLSSAGVLVGVASKNDPALVRVAFDRPDLLLPKDIVYPVEANWGPKSDSIRQILAAWNVAPDSVIFIDDSPMELAEVQSVFPEIEGLQFVGRDPKAVWNLAERLRDLCGKSVLHVEDFFRLSSVRRGDAFRGKLQATTQAPDAFLSAAKGVLRFDLRAGVADSRAFELMNKTNQFNLNGRRFSDSAWRDVLSDKSAFLLTATYQDKYGPLGKIGALLGHRLGDRLHVDAWVLSCRAFSRRIEYHMLGFLFDRFKVDEIAFDFSPTPRNGPIQDFFARFLDARASIEFALPQKMFRAMSPALIHRVEHNGHG